MGPLKVSFALVVVATLAWAAPAPAEDASLSEPIDSQAVKGAPRPPDYVYTVEKFYRTYEDGTIEFMLVLSNGLAQFQKITNKDINGVTIQVYEGYYSTPLPDGTYATTYYTADENGYVRTKQARDTKKPDLPPYVPHVPKTQA